MSGLHPTCPQCGRMVIRVNERWPKKCRGCGLRLHLRNPRKKKPRTNSPYVSTGWFAQHFGLAQCTVVAGIVRGTTPAIKVGRLWRIPLSHVEQLEKKVTDLVKSEGSKEDDGEKGLN